MFKHVYHYTIFGQVSDPNAYGGGSYSAETYSSGTTQTGTEQPTTTPSGGDQLAYTGFDVVIPVALGAAMIVGSVIALVKMRSSKKA